MSGRLRIDGRHGPVDIEYAWVGDPASPAPVVVFLHEGLGSVAMWRDFPEAFCRANALRGFVYSRRGYGRSTPKPPGENWAPDFMHREADEMLPRILAAAGIDRPALFGHSDGGSIALLHAATHEVPAVVVMAPHLFVEEVSIASVAEARRAWETTDLRTRLGRYHDDPESAFRGWNDGWLSPAFRGWNIEPQVARIRCPVLAVQGEDDEYGTLEQVRTIERLLPGQTELLELPGCGHAPHRDRPEDVTAAAGAFIRRAVGCLPAASRRMAAAPRQDMDAASCATSRIMVDGSHRRPGYRGDGASSTTDPTKDRP